MRKIIGLTVGIVTALSLSISLAHTDVLRVEGGGTQTVHIIEDGGYPMGAHTVLHGNESLNS